MTIEIEQISASADDADETNFGTLDTTSSTMDLKGNMYGAGVRFINVDIPASATIDDATLKLRTLSASCAASGNCKHTIYGDNADNPPIWSNGYKPSGSVQTTANKTWNVTVNQAVNGHGTHNIDVKAIVIEITDRAGWSSGNAMSFIIEVDSYGKLNNLSIDAYDGIPSLSATLTVNYTTATGQSITKTMLGTGL